MQNGQVPVIRIETRHTVWQELLEALLGLLGAAVGEDWPEIPEMQL